MGRAGRGMRGALAGLAIAAAASAQAARLEVHVTGVTDPHGHVRVSLCTRQTFLTDSCPYEAAAPAMVGDTRVQIDAPPGLYALQVFHDETDSGRIHQNILGIPHERIGFSNDAPLGIRGPSFDDAAFVIGAEVRTLTLRLRRLAGN